MVLIAHRGDLNAAFWVDGFLPEREKLEEAYLREFRKEAEIVKEKDIDWLASALLDDLHNRQEKQYGCPYSYLYLRHNYGTAPEVSALVTELNKKSSIPSKKDYRQIITVCDIQAQERIEKCTNEIADQLGLEIRQDYFDRDAFERSVGGLLELAVEPYVYPQAAAARQLRQFGLTKLSAI